MASKFVFDGMDEFKRQLMALPRDMKDEAAGLASEAANDAASELRQEYAEVSGRLKAGVQVSKLAVGSFGAGATLKNTNPLAWLYDNGSQARHWASGKSTGKMWGKSRPKHLFVRTAIKYRQRFYERVKDMMRAKGLQVSGDER